MDILKAKLLLKKRIRPYYIKYFRPLQKLLFMHACEKRLNMSGGYLKSLKNIYNGERCFIIGNGPSLNARDLNKLKKEICFGTNRIYNIFSETDWRPTYYCTTDYKVIRSISREITKRIDSDMLIGVEDFRLNPLVENGHYFKLVAEDFYPNPPKFSEDISKCIYEGFTVTYACMQIAAYMGFKEIFLLGVDHSFSIMQDENGNIIRNPEVTDHFSDKDKIFGYPSLFKTTLAYETANKFCENHGVKIYNATRGGKLEVFERVDFDSLF